MISSLLPQTLMSQDFDSQKPVASTSPEFKDFISFLKYLKQAQSPVIQSKKPSICLTCWEIILAENVSQHATHERTQEFSLMEEASEQTFLGLGKGYKRYNQSKDQIVLLKISPNFKNLVIGQNQMSQKAMQHWLTKDSPNKAGQTKESNKGSKG